MKYKRSLAAVVAILLFLVAWAVLLMYVSPTDIVEYIGVENTLIVAFFLSTLGGLSSLTSASYYGMIVTFATGGTDPILLGISAGVGLVIGDMLVYYLGTKGRKVLLGNGHVWVDKLTAWIHKQEDYAIQIFVYFYTAFTLLPDDIITSSLGLAKYSYRRLVIALLLGNTTRAIIVAQLAIHTDIVERIFGT